MFNNFAQGINNNSIKQVEEWLPFDEDMAILKNDDIHPLVRSAYLDFVVSAYLDRTFQERGMDIHALTQCYVRFFQYTLFWLFFVVPIGYILK